MTEPNVIPPAKHRPDHPQAILSNEQRALYAIANELAELNTNVRHATTTIETVRACFATTDENGSYEVIAETLSRIRAIVGNR